MESLIDNCWQFRSRQLPKTLITNFLRRVCSHGPREPSASRLRTFRLGLIEFSDFHPAVKRDRFDRGCECDRACVCRYLSSDVERFLETLHFNYPAPDKRNHGWEINFSIPYLPFVLLLIFLLSLFSFSLFSRLHEVEVRRATFEV